MFLTALAPASDGTSLEYSLANVHWASMNWDKD